jgi:hypothetical protein
MPSLSGDSNRLKLEVGKFFNLVSRPDNAKAGCEAGLHYLHRSGMSKAYVPGCATGTAGGTCLRNRIRWYSQPIATSTRPRHMNDSAR